MSKKEVDVGYYNMQNNQMIDIDQDAQTVTYTGHLWYDVYTAKPGNHLQERSGGSARVTIVLAGNKSHGVFEVLDGFDWKPIVHIRAGYIKADRDAFNTIIELKPTLFEEDVKTLVDMFKVIV